VSKALTEFVAPASDCLVGHDHPALEKQRFDVAQAQLRTKIPTHSATDDLGWETMTPIQRFSFLHRNILSDRPNNLTIYGHPRSYAMNPNLVSVPVTDPSRPLNKPSFTEP
jgi:hypothetical protein